MANKLLKYKKIEYIILILLCTVCVTPIILRDFPKIIYVFLWGSYFFLFFLNKNRVKISAIRLLMNLGFAYIILTFFYVFLGFSDSTYFAQFNLLLSIFPIFLYSEISKENDFNVLKTIFHILSLVILINIADSIRLSILYPFLSYEVNSAELMEDARKGINIGGSSFLTMAIFYVYTMAFAYNNTYNRKEKNIFMLYIIIALLFIVFFSFKASVILLGLAGLVCQYYAYKSSKSKVVTVVALFSFILLFIFKDHLLLLLIDLIDSDRITERLLVFVSSNNSGANDASITIRGELWQTSIDTWLTNPVSFFMGIGDNTIDGFSGFVTGIGGHSDFLDVLAKFGLLGGLILYGIYICLYKAIKRNLSPLNYKELNYFFIFVFIVGITKKIILPEVSIILFVLYPLCTLCYRRINTK